MTNLRSAIFGAALGVILGLAIALSMIVAFQSQGYCQSPSAPVPTIPAYQGERFEDGSYIVTFEDGTTASGCIPGELCER